MLSENNWLQNKVFNINPFCLNKIYRKKTGGALVVAQIMIMGS